MNRRRFVVTSLAAAIVTAPQDGQGAGSDAASVAAGARRSGDRVTGRADKIDILVGGG